MLGRGSFRAQPGTRSRSSKVRAEAGSSRPAWIRDLVSGVADDDEMVGFVYFNQNGSARWKIDSDQAAVTALRKRVDTSTFGFEVR